MARVFGLFAEREAAWKAIQQLQSAGFVGNDLGLLTRVESEEPNPLATGAKGAATGATAGGIAGGLLGAAATGLIPGIGPVLAAGSIVPLLAGIATGASTGLLTGAIVGAATGERPLGFYEQEVRGGRTLVTVEAGGRASEAMDMLRAAGALEATPIDEAASGSPP